MNKIIELPIKSVDYDKSNPRIATVFDEAPDQELSPDDISRALREESSESLRRSIKKTAGIKNPIKVTPTENGRYRVFEGNTRLSIYRSFQKNGDEGDWSKIPSIVFDSISQKEIDVILMQDHIVGTQPWGAYAKARYLNHLFTNDCTTDEIAQICGISNNEILRSIETYNFMGKHYRKIIEEEELDGPSPDPMFNERKYTAFEEYIKRDDVKKAVDYAGYTEKDFSRWVACGLFTRNEDVRDLAAILKNEAARKTFLLVGSREAKKYVDSPNLKGQLKEASITQLCDAIIRKTSEIQSGEIKLLMENQTDALKIFDASAELSSFYDTYLSK